MEPRARMPMPPTDARSAPDELAQATPTLRLFGLLEAVAGLSCRFTLQELVTATGLPKPTVHRMLTQLERADIVVRDPDERQYALGARMRNIASELLLRDSLHGARHAVLRQLCEAVGESCNLTALMAGEVVYLDRVETAAPLRVYLHPGSRVPAHASASGKLLLGQLAPAERKRLLSVPLERFTPQTLTDAHAVEQAVARSCERGWSVDDEEFLPGLVCVAVPLPAPAAHLALALQGPSVRVHAADAERYLPALQRAAEALARL